MKKNTVVKMIEDSIVPASNPGVYISGGLDSTIILHHLREKYDGEIFTYTARFDVDGDEVIWAKMVADHYGTNHKEVHCSGWLNILPEIQKGLTHPRYNVWCYFLAKRAKNDGVENIYIGEGADEHFGGYDRKPYLQAWGDHFTYIRQMFDEIHGKFDLNVHYPFDKLNWKDTIKYYTPPNKYYLREVYSEILPNFIVEGRRKIAPAFTNYWQMWFKYLRPRYSNYKPDSIEDIRKLLRYIAVKTWMEANTEDYEPSQ